MVGVGDFGEKMGGLGGLGGLVWTSVNGLGDGIVFERNCKD